jgi:transposase
VQLLTDRSVERQARHRQQVKLHKRIWKLYRQGYHKEQIAQLVGVSSRKVYRVLEQETPPSSRSVALMMVRPAQSRTREQAAYLDQLIQSNETIAVVFTLAQDFGHLLAISRGASATGAVESRRSG